MALFALLVTFSSVLLSLSVSVAASGGHGHGNAFPADLDDSFLGTNDVFLVCPETTRISSKAAYFHDHGSQRVTIKYGAVTVPPMTDNDGMAQFFHRATTLPCQDCFITYLSMGLEHADGRTADADTGMWLHHGVLINRNQTDAVCGGMGQRFAASGNERTAIEIAAGGTFKAGYYIGTSDEVSLAVDLMNMRQDRPQDDIVFTITYEYVHARDAQGFSPIIPYWLDVGGCRTSDQPAYRDSTFIYTSPVLLGTQQGTITFVGGHLHDGGTHINLIKNGKLSCGASAAYDPYANVNDAGTTEHISSIGTCTMLGETTPGDGWFINAYYDTTVHEPMALMDGSLEPVMGIMLLYVAQAVGQPEVNRPRYWTVVLGLGCLAALVISIAAWLWFRERRAIRLKGSPFGGLIYKDPQPGQEASVPLMES
ncbi:hypothetical protein CLCR_04839 [Cladophialophora carrionii]|uniref:Uncharacterized protein n=1 Tax=Cladophialophora carrionii TaxID=86049 RepID=A0A1C1CLU6_9EURO|nr:hypothetical protein CLCR_04839 [Cladophialophora carrionii]